MSTPESGEAATRMTAPPVDLHLGDDFNTENATPAESLAALLSAIGRDPAEPVVISVLGPDKRMSSTRGLLSDPIIGNRLNAPGDVFFTVPIVDAPENGGRGGARDTRGLTCLWIDIDDKHSAGGDWREYVNDVSTTIGAAPVAVVETGGGRHVYWRLSEPLAFGSLDDDAGRAAVDLMSSFESIALEADERHRIGIDSSVFEFARVLRVPGTVNRKPAYDSPLVSLSLADGGGVDAERVLSAGRVAAPAAVEAVELVANPFAAADLDRLIAALEAAGRPVVVERARRYDDEREYRAQCPAHTNDGLVHSDTSLSFGLRGGRLAVHCFADCSFEAVKRSLGLWIEATPEALTASAEIGSDEWNMLVQDEARKMLLRSQAKEFAAALTAEAMYGKNPFPVALSGADYGRMPEPENKYFIEGLHTEGNVIVSAQAKAGKTTLLFNLCRSMVTGDPFLGQFTMNEPLAADEHVLYLDFELNESLRWHWLHSIGLLDERLLFVGARGLAGSFAHILSNADARERWAAQYRDKNIKMIVVDPIAPVLASFGDAGHENDNSAVRNVLDNMLNPLRESLNAPHMLIVHHAGHSGDRARGAAAFQDMPDSLWTISTTGDDDDPSRFFKVKGRDVSVPSTEIVMDEVSRRLTMGTATRAEIKAAERSEARASKHRRHIVQVLDEAPDRRIEGFNNLHKMVRELTSIGDKTLKTEIERMKSDGVLEVLTEGQSAVYHYTPEKAVIWSA